MSFSTLQLEAAPKATSIDFGEEVMCVYLEDGRAVQVPLAWYPRLEFATGGERENYELFNEGVAVHWPDIDEDVRIIDLLAGRASREGENSLDRWKLEMASRRRQKTPQPWGVDAPLTNEMSA